MLLGTPDSTKKELDYVSVDQHVDRDSSPAFIMHTFADRDVDVRNTLSLAKGYADAGVPFEMHIYPNGYHGVALANKITDMGNPAYDDPIIAEWVRLAAAWTDKVGSLEYLDRN
jgi:acetyl esterase/lipase